MPKSQSDEWGTPQDLFDSLDAEFFFDVDVCASDENHKCSQYITAEQNALVTPWGSRADYSKAFCFMNPPHSLLKEFLKRAWEQSYLGRTVVGLIPARTDTAAWHDYVMRAYEVRLVRGRLTFEGAPTGAPFPSAIVVWRPFWPHSAPPVFRSCDRLGRTL